MAYHSKVTDNARLAEMVRLPKMFENYSTFSQRSPKVTEDVLFVELVGFPKMVNNVRFSGGLSKIND